MIYFEILICSLFILTFSDFVPKFRNITLPLSFILCVIIAGFRNMGGVDFIYYKNHYYGYETSSFEAGYEFIVKFFNLFGLSYEQYVFCLAFLSLLLLFICIKRYSPMPQFTILLYVGSFFIFYNIIAIRQSIAIVLFLLSLRYLEQKYYVTYFLFLLGAFLFHNSAIILFIATFFIKYFNLKVVYILILGTIIGLVYSLNLFDLLSLFPTIGLSFITDKMQYYTDDDRAFTFVTIAKLSILSLLTLSVYKKMIGIPYFKIFANMTLLYVSLFVMFSRWGVLTRLWVYFEIGYLFLIPIVLQFKKRQLQILIYYSFACMAVYSILNMVQSFDDGDLLLFKLNFL